MNEVRATYTTADDPELLFRANTLAAGLPSGLVLTWTGSPYVLLMPNRPPAPHAVAAGLAGPPSRWLPRRKTGSIESATLIEYKFIRTGTQILAAS